MDIIKVGLCNEIINRSLIRRMATHPFGAPDPFPLLSIKEMGMLERKRIGILPKGEEKRNPLPKVASTRLLELRVLHASRGKPKLFWDLCMLA